MGHNRGHISDNLLDKFTASIQTTCSESDCQWTLVSFLVNIYQFYREPRLTCPFYRSTEDICIGIYVFKRVFNVWHILKKSVSMQQHFEQFVRKQKEVLNWSLLEIL